MYSRISAILSVIYILFLITVNLSDSLQESYFSITASLPVMLINFVLPPFLVLIISFSIMPVFASETERNTNQIPFSCYIGRVGRNISKVIAAIIYSILNTLFMILFTFLICCTAGNSTNKNQIIYDFGGEIFLKINWNVRQHCVFAAIVLIIGSIALTALILLISSRTKNIITSAGISVIVLTFEFLFNKFSFPVILREYNIWVLFRPYYIYILNIFSFKPYLNLILFTLVFSPICIFALCEAIYNDGLMK